ncbi:unnamed protein product [Mytilus coruscus]|uniref:Uncharacterized protein n=1 Tax=Mytilus coruscus TaxID=42192 RepID=A0A6J8AYX9_MYTCO|nr:unnamed protein product [Mytilus coruscus]
MFRVLKEVPREMTPNKAKTKEETTSHLSKLKEEWRKLHRNHGNRDSTHIKMLLRETLDYRDEFLRSHTNSVLKDLVEEFPCFSDALYVLFEFAVRFGDKKLKEVSQSIKTTVATTLKMMGITKDHLTEGPETMTEVIKYLEDATKFDRSGKGRDGHFSSIIKIYENIEDDDVKNKLKSKEMTPPHLVIFKSESKKLAIYIVGDSIHISSQGSTVTSVITQLLAIYYVFDIDYPKCYAMVLGLLQIFVMNEAFTYETSKKFKFYAKKFRTVFDSFAKDD